MPCLYLRPFNFYALFEWTKSQPVDCFKWMPLLASVKCPCWQIHVFTNCMNIVGSGVSSGAFLSFWHCFIWPKITKQIKYRLCWEVSGFYNLLPNQGSSTILSQPSGVCWIFLETSLQLGKPKTLVQGGVQEASWPYPRASSAGFFWRHRVAALPRTLPNDWASQPVSHAALPLKLDMTWIEQPPFSGYGP